jgi:hypothetical protein
VQLRDVLERLDNETARSAPPPSAADPDACPAASVAPADGLLPPPTSDAGPDGPPGGLRGAGGDPEEASVTFVVREPVRPARAEAPAEVEALPAQPPADPPDAASAGDEAQVTIVRRPR